MLGYLRRKQYEYAQRMLAKLDTQGVELDALWSTIDSILDQFYLERATWGLDIWEEEWGLPTNPNESYETRRSRIRAKIIGGGTFTEQTARDLANAYSRMGSALFLPFYEEYTFKTIYNVDDLISYSNLKTAFDEVKPAHLLHIVGLIVKVMFPISDQISARIRSCAELDYWEALCSSKIKGSYLYLSFGKYEVDDINKLCFNGAWKFDGSQRFNGVNAFGIDLYLDIADQCTVRHIRGETIDEEVI